MRFNETVHNKWCWHKSVRQTENGLERGFVEPWKLRSNNWPDAFNAICLPGWRIALKA